MTISRWPLQFPIWRYHHLLGFIWGLVFFVFTIPGCFEPLIEKQTRQKVDGFFLSQRLNRFGRQNPQKKRSDFSIHTCRIHLKIWILFSPLYRKLCIWMGFRVSLSRFRELKRRSGRPPPWGCSTTHLYHLFGGSRYRKRGGEEIDSKPPNGGDSKLAGSRLFYPVVIEKL